MRILLTGGRGFVGTTLREALGSDHEIVAPSHAALDVTDASAVDAVVASGRFDAIIHAAIQGVEGVVEKTLRGFWNVARNASRVGRVLYFGSGAEYGKQRDLVKVREEDIGRVVPLDPYGFAKLLCNEHARRSGRIVNLRLFGVYGPHEGTLFRFISNTIAKALLGIRVAVKQDVVFDYLFADDLAKIVRHVLGNGSVSPDLNVTPDESISLREILAIVGGLAGPGFHASFEQEGLNFEYTGDNRLLRESVPGLAFTPYADGIRKVWDHLVDRPDALDVEALERDDFRARCRPRPAPPARKE